MPMTDANIAHSPRPSDQALPIGTVLSGDQFTVTEHLGAGGFGITYRAKDNVLGRTIVIKECFPEDFCIRDSNDMIARSQSMAKPVRSITKMFMREAQSLAKLRHPNIVGVHRAFEENQTAYMVLDLIDGRDLFDILKTKKTRLSPTRVKDILLQLLDAIETVHNAGLLHRNISPDNIILERSGTPVLIDFGAARAEASSHTRAVSALMVVKDGYSPQEFYVAGSEQTPCSDLYALGATFYHLITGQAPVNSQTRLIEIAGKKPDPCVPLAGNVMGYDDAFLQAIDQAMQIHPDDRLQSAAKWRSLIADTMEDSDGPVQSRPRTSGQEISLELEMSLSRLVEETNDVVRKTTLLPANPEPAPVKPEAPSKPAWIDEFNRESLAPDPVTSPPEPSPEVALDEAFNHMAESEAMGDDDASSDPARATKSETNWIDRALEKQERLQSERERSWEAFEAGESAPGADPQLPPVTAHDDPANIAAAPEASRRSGLKPLGIMIGLFICVYCLVLLQAA